MRYLILLAFLIPITASAQIPFARHLQLPTEYESHRVSHNIKIPPGKEITYLDTEGPGAITHIWMTVDEMEHQNVVLRMYWDGEDEPSVEAPVSDFFGVGHGMRDPTNYFTTPALSVVPRNGYNIYLPMPFRDSCRITVANDGDKPWEGGGVYMQADYQLYDELPDDTPYFHAMWRREAPAPRRARPYTIIKAVGEGFVAGMTYHLNVKDEADAWYHGGGDLVMIDAQSNPHVLHGIGGEDYIGQSWGSEEFTGLQSGVHLKEDGKLSVYRFYLEGPIKFDDSVHMAFQAMANTLTSVGYWYQTEPHTPFAELPPLAQRQPQSTLQPGTYERDVLPEQQIPAAVLGPFAGDIDTSFEVEEGFPESLDVEQTFETNYQGPFGYDHPGPDQDDRMVRWKQARTTMGWLDFAAIYKPKMKLPSRHVQTLSNTVSYAVLRIEAEEAGRYEVLLGHDDAVRIWVNDQVPITLAKQEGYTGRTVELELEKGENTVLIKVHNTSNVNFHAYLLSMHVEDREALSFGDFSSLTEALTTR